MNEKGITLFELLAVLLILAILITIGLGGFRSLLSRIEIDQGVREVILSLHHARYLSIKNGFRVKPDFQPGRILLLLEIQGQWKTARRIDLDPDLKIRLSAVPCFYPQGHIVPLFSLEVENREHRYKISASIAGRFKVRKLWKF